MHRYHIRHDTLQFGACIKSWLALVVLSMRLFAKYQSLDTAIGTNPVRRRRYVWYVTNTPSSNVVSCTGTKGQKRDGVSNVVSCDRL